METLARRTLQKSDPYRNALLEQMVEGFMGLSGFSELKDTVQKLTNRVNSVEQKVNTLKKKKDGG